VRSKLIIIELCGNAVAEYTTIFSQMKQAQLGEDFYRRKA